MEDGVLNQLEVLNVSFATWDIVIALGVLALSLVFVYTIGKDHAVNLLIGGYIATVTLLLLPFFQTLEFALFDAPAFVHRVALFAILTILFTALLMRNGFFESYVLPEGWESAIFAIAFAGLFVFVTITLLPAEFTATFSPVMKTLFLTEPYNNIWLAFPAVMALFLRG